MNRLTERTMDNVYYLKGKYPPATLCAEMETWEVRECMAKLAAYEDTGLEPEEVKQLNTSDASKEESSIKYYNEMRKYRNETQMLTRQIERMAEWIFDNAFVEICNQASQTNNCDEHIHCTDCIMEYFQEKGLIKCIKEKINMEE